MLIVVTVSCITCSQLQTSATANNKFHPHFTQLTGEELIVHFRASLLLARLFRDKLVVRLGVLGMPARKCGSLVENIVEVVAHSRLVKFPRNVVCCREEGKDQSRLRGVRRGGKKLTVGADDVEFVQTRKHFFGHLVAGSQTRCQSGSNKQDRQSSLELRSRRPQVSLQHQLCVLLRLQS